MGWLHDFNLKRKVAGVLTTHRGLPQTAANIAREANAEQAEVERLLDQMERGAFVFVSHSAGVPVYQLNEAQGTVSKVLQTFEDKDQQLEQGMTLRSTRYGWTAELMEPAGMLVMGKTREEARERGRALMEKMAALPTASESKELPNPGA